MFLPYGEFELTTPYHTDQVFERLSSQVSLYPDQLLHAKYTQYSYTGSVSGNQFKFTKVIPSRRNSFYPRITGVVTEQAGGSRIHVEMKPSIFDLILLGILLSAILIAELYLIVTQLQKDGPGIETAVIPILFFAVYFAAIGTFKAESIEAEYFLKNLFETKKP